MSEPPPPEGAPLVSIIVRGMGRVTLPATLRSVIAQSYRLLEIVLVDAAGKGEQPPPCDGFPLVTVCHNRPLSRAAAANAGLDAASGAYLMLLDDGHWIHPDHVATLVDALGQCDLSRAAYAGVECVDVSGYEPRRLRVSNEPFDALRLRFENYIPLHAMLFSRTLLGAGCRFDTSLPLFEDWDFWLQVAECTTVHHVPRVTAVCRLPGGRDVHDDLPAAERALGLVFAKWAPRSVEMTASLLTRLRLQIVRADAEATVLKDQVAVLREEVAALRSTTEPLPALPHGAVCLSADLGAASALRERSCRIDDLRRVAAENAARVTEMQASLSWRITAPARALHRWICGRG